ncbi:MAG: PA2778 family cysteine peptidase [Gammaproteobacteria bacterium]|nr:tetratricopeptide repeat protein [Sideroxydans sp.]MBU3904418.1 PA2778 family cysteine peptidase [Gammaproteobacteria bacterium]MBU4044973.1 PA2778 family cysteine peptidase [Gammaproteobacteria bacterium]
MSRAYASLMAGIFLLMLGGCRTLPPPAALSEDMAAALPRQIELSEVPFFAQEDYQCGPAALAMVMKHAGLAVDPEVLKPEVYLPGREGSLQVEMMGATRRHGLVAYQMSPVLGEVLEEVARGTPVVVLQNLALDWYPVWHYAVVIGYDLNKKEVILRSGRERDQRISLVAFENTWARSAHWAMVAMPPEKVPYTATESRYVAAVNAFGKVGQLPASRLAYLSAKKRWPDSLGVSIGLGNIAYLMKRMDEAEAEFRAAVTAHPDSVAALNNLAQTLSDMGHDEEALVFVQRAAELGGPLHDIVLSTQASIERKLK